MSNILPTTANNFSQKEKMELMQKIDSLETYQRQVQEQELALRAILMGDGEVPENIALQEREEQTSSSPPAANLFTPNPVNYTFYSPVKGVVTDTFNVERKHYAVDVVAKKGDIVKSAQQGTVIFSAWNPETGYTLVIQHANDFLSVYKHNSKLLKKEGNFVRAGDAVALVGSTGELTSGPHLHFELWNKGVALDPQKYISFK